MHFSVLNRRRSSNATLSLGPERPDMAELFVVENRWSPSFEKRSGDEAETPFFLYCVGLLISEDALLLWEVLDARWGPLVKSALLDLWQFPCASARFRSSCDNGLCSSAWSVIKEATSLIPDSCGSLQAPSLVKVPGAKDACLPL